MGGSATESADHLCYKCPSRSPESNVICRPGKDPAKTYPDARSFAAYFDHWVKDWQVGTGQNEAARGMRRKNRAILRAEIVRGIVFIGLGPGQSGRRQREAGRGRRIRGAG